MVKEKKQEKENVIGQDTTTGKVVVAVFRITGVSPLLQNNPASMGGGAAKGPEMKSIPTPEVEAASKVYKDEEGLFYILSESFRSSIVGKGGAASGYKKGKVTMIAACGAGLFTMEPRCLLLDPKNEWKPLDEYKIDTRRAVIKGAGVLRSRPMFLSWGCDIAFELDEAWVKPDEILFFLNRAGKICGVGDFRPQKKGTFGRFSAELKSIS
jgi:hypothetical protein